MARHYLALAVILFILWLPLLHPLGAQDMANGWRREIKRGAMTIDSRRMASGLWEFRARLERLHIRPHAFLLALLDIRSHPLWLQDIQHTRIIAQPQPNQFLVQTVFDLPWPYKNRELVNFSHYWQRQDSCIIQFEAIAVPTAIPPTPGTVRIQLAHALWQMIPEADNTVTLSYQGFVDPGGNIPQWQTKGMMLDSLKFSLQQLPSVLTLPRYQLPRFPRIDPDCTPASFTD